MSDELPPPPPGITLMSLQEFLGRRESATNAAPQVSSRMQTPGDQSAPGKRPAVAALQETEYDALRQGQAESVMPLIGNLLDQWDGVPNDLKSDDGLEGVRRVIDEINYAMENAKPSEVPHKDGILSEEWLSAVERGDCSTTDCKVLVDELRRLAEELAEAKDDRSRLHREKMEALFGFDGCPRNTQSATNAAPSCPCTPADRIECHATPDVNRPTNCVLRSAVAAPSETPRTDAQRANPDGFSYDEAIAWAEQLERERNAWEAKFNAECEKHDATTLRAMKAERDLALALDHIEKDDKEIERLHNEIDALRSKK